MSPVNRHRFWLGVAVALTALKLWLSRGQGVYAIGGASEDRLFIELAQQLVRGEWFAARPPPGAGAFYPSFIAAAFWLGVPLFLAQHLFYALACALFTRALQPMVTWAGARLAIYALLLANPMTFDGPGMGRVLPQQVTGPLGLMIFAGLIALALRRSEPDRRQAPWAVLLGFAVAAFCLSGGEKIWLVPSALWLAGTYLFGSWKISRAAVQSAAGWLGLALVVAALFGLVVGVKNQPGHDQAGAGELRAPVSADKSSAGPRPGLGSAVDFVTSFSRFSALVPPSTGSQEELQLFRDLTHERLSPPVGELDRVGGDRYLLNLGKVAALHRIGKTLRPVLTALFWLAQVLVLLRAGQAAWRRQWTFPLTVAVAAWGAWAAAVFLQAGTAPTIPSFAPVYPLLLVFISATLWDAATTWIARAAVPPRADPVR